MTGAPPAGAVLTGGASRRMGRPKAWIEIGGTTLAERVAGALTGGGCVPVAYVGAAAPPGRAPHGRRVVPDRQPGAGPVGGVVSALEALGTLPDGRERDVVVAACDLARLDAATVARIVEARRPPGAGAVSAVAASRHVPLARWSPTSLGPLADLLVAGRASWWRALEAVGAVEVSIAAEVARDVDEPADLGSVARVVPEIDVETLAELMERARAEGRSVRLIDVREADEYAAGHVPGAVSIPLSTVPEHLDRFASEDTTYVICKVGGRSLQVCELAADHGADVVNVAGGTLAWVDSGRPTVSDDR